MSSTSYLFVDPTENVDKKTLRSHVARECRRRRNPQISRTRKFDLQFELKSPIAKERISRISPSLPPIIPTPQNRLQQKQTRTLSSRPPVGASSFQSGPYYSRSFTENIDSRLETTPREKEAQAGGTQPLPAEGTGSLCPGSPGRQFQSLTLRTSPPRDTGAFSKFPPLTTDIQDPENSLTSEKQPSSYTTSSCSKGDVEEVIGHTALLGGGDCHDDSEETQSSSSALTIRKRLRDKYRAFTYVANGSVDPFQSHPTTALGPSVSLLLDYSQSNFILSAVLSSTMSSTLSKSEDLHRLLTIYLTKGIKILWPALRPYASDGLENPAARRWLPQALTHPALFYGFMYGAAAHLQATRGFPDWDDCAEVRISQAEAIIQLNKDIRDPERACLDETILAVLCMAANGIAPPLRKPVAPAQSGSRCLQSLDTYATLSTVPVHAEGLARLVELRGGLENLKLDGLAETLSFSDILTASRYLIKPSWTFISNLEGKANGKEHHCSPPHPARQLLGQGFSIVGNLTNCTCDVTPRLLAVLDGMCNYTAAIDNFTRPRTPSSPRPLLELIDERNRNQHHLMCLPHTNEHRVLLPCDGNGASDDMYELTRLAAVIYSIIVVFPLTPPFAPFGRLASLLKVALTNPIPLSSAAWRKDAPHLLVWITTMGAIAAMDLPDRDWYVVSVNKICLGLGIGSWVALKRVLKTFLWSDRTNDMDGMALWAEVERSRALGRS